MNIIYLAFGTPQSIYYQTFFSIQTLWIQNYQNQNIAIHLFTDHPEYFERLVKHIPLKLHPMSEEQIASWSKIGEELFLFKVKLKVIDVIIQEYPDAPILYLDSDTFVYGSLQSTFDVLNAGHAIMHERERLLSNPLTKSEKHLWKVVNNQTIANIKITKQQMGWNAGIIGIPKKDNKKAIALATTFCYELYSKLIRKNYSEQIAFSIVLSSMYDLVDCKDSIGHYWGNKESWNDAIKFFYLQSYMQNFDFNKEMEHIKNFDFHKIAYRKKYSNTRIRLNKVIGKWFVDTQFLFTK